MLAIFFFPIHWNLPVFTGPIMGCSVHAPELPNEHFTSRSAGFCSPIRPLFPERGNRLLWQWERGWGLVYMALSTVAGFTGYTHHCIWEEPYRLGKADHPEAYLGPVFLGRHQFLLCAGTDVFVVVLWNQSGNWSSLKLKRSERVKKWTLIGILPSCLCWCLEKGWWDWEWAAMTVVKVRLLL